MPSLGADMDRGVIVEWRVKPGDPVQRGDIVAVVDTEKSTIEIEIFDTGTIGEILVPEGEEVPVGTVLATVVTAGEPAPPVAAPAPEAPRVRISPMAKRRAAELHVDAATIAGTGADGAVTVADVERVAAQTEAPVPRTAPADRKASMRAAIGDLMARSKREIPHYYLSTHIDMRAALAWLEKHNASRPVAERLLPSVLLLRAVALAAVEVPDMNGFWVDGAFRAAEAVHLGVAISLRGGGLIAPAIHDANAKTVDELMADLRDLVTRARSGVLRSSEMSDPTITVTNLGDQGVEAVFGVIYPPQVALVGFGKVVEQPWAADGMVGARPVVHATLAADHRASDGHLGGLFLARIDHLLQEPEKL